MAKKVKTKPFKVEKHLDNPEVAAEYFLDQFRCFVTDYYGKMCKEACPGCKACQMWALYHAVDMVVDRG